MPTKHPSIAIATAVPLTPDASAQPSLAQLRQAAKRAPRDPRVLAALGEALLQAGRDKDAAKAFRQAAKLDPRSLALLAKLAQALIRAGQGGSAETVLLRAFSGGLVTPDDGVLRDTLCDLLVNAWGEPERAEDAERVLAGLARFAAASNDPAPLCWVAERFRQRRMLQFAIEACNLALDRWPQHAGAFAVMAEALADGDDAANAERAARLALERDLSHVPARIALSRAQIGQSDYVGAEKTLQEALLLAPGDHEVLGHYANLLFGLSRFAESLALVDRAIGIEPNTAGLHGLRATVLVKLGRAEDAAAAADAAVRCAPRDPQQYVKKAECLIECDRFVEAEQAIAAALTLAPTFGRAFAARCRLRGERGDLEGAIADGRRAVALDPQSLVCWNTLGNMLIHRRDYAEALACFEKAGSLGPLSSQTLYNQSFALLAVGRLAQGWDHYEVGVHAHLRNVWRRTTRPVWEGEPLQGRTLGIIAEQGIGDQLMYLSCLPDFRRKIGTDVPLTLEVNPKLLGLVRRTFPDAEVRPAVRDAERHAVEDFDTFDVAMMMGSLPGVVRRSLDDFPAEPVRNFAPDAARVEHWRRRLRERGDGPVIGLCWRSLHLTTRRSKSYVRVEDMEPIFRLAGVRCVSLQYGDARAELAEIEARFPGRILGIEDEADLTDDLDEVAAILCALDAVVAPGTSVSSLGGALGVPTYEFTHYTWMRMGTDRIPWYPSVRNFEYTRDVDLAVAIPLVRDALVADFGLTGALA